MSLSDLIASILHTTINAATQRRRDKRGVIGKPPGQVAQAPAREELEIGVELADPLLLRRLGPAYVPPRVNLPLELRRRHIYGTGTSGSGKTSFALHLMDQDIAAGMSGQHRGVGCVDPEGDLIDRVLRRIAARYTEADIASRVVLIDFRQHHTWSSATVTPYCTGWNPLRDAGADPTAAALFCYDIFADIYEIGPASGELLRYALLALANSSSVGRTGQGTLLDIEPFLLEFGFRKEALASVTDVTLTRFFKTRFETLIQNQTLISAILNKISPLTSLPSVRQHLGMRQGTLPLRHLVTQPGTILLCALAANEIGSLGAGLIGRLLIQSIARSFIRSDRLLTEHSGSFFLTLDEFSLFSGSNDVVTDIAAQGRRYGLHLLALHQSAAQLDAKTRSVLRNTIGTQIYFACGGGDADTLASELPTPGGEPVAVIRNWLITQKPGQAILAESGKAIRRIECHYSPDPKVEKALVCAIRQKALEHFGRPVAEVAAEIAAHETRFTTQAVPAAVPVPSRPTTTARKGRKNTAPVEIVSVEEVE